MSVVQASRQPTVSRSGGSVLVACNRYRTSSEHQAQLYNCECPLHGHHIRSAIWESESESSQLAVSCSYSPSVNVVGDTDIDGDRSIYSNIARQYVRACIDSIHELIRYTRRPRLDITRPICPIASNSLESSSTSATDLLVVRFKGAKIVERVSSAGLKMGP